MSDSTVYVLGAGTSVCSGTPVLKNFFRHVMDNYFSDERVQRVAAFLAHFFRSDPRDRSDLLPKYETVLTFLDLALQHGGALDARYHEREILQLRDDMLYLLWLVLKSTALATPDPVHVDFVSRVLQAGDTIISLNYDLLVDHAIHAAYGGVNYGIPFERTHNPSPPRDCSGGSTTRTSPPALLKIHGSLNWLFCPTCSSMSCYLGGRSTARIFSPPGEHCPEDGSYLKGVLIPPTWVKNYRNPHLQSVWLDAEAALRRAARVVFIGYSLANSDVQVVFSLCRALHNNRQAPPIHVVNPERRDTVRQRYERMFGPITYHQMTFDEWIGDT